MATDNWMSDVKNELSCGEQYPVCAPGYKSEKKEPALCLIYGIIMCTY